jgi:hypothetical protein
MGWDRELAALEDALRNLNAQYDAFLYGSAPKPPLEIRRRIGQQIRRLGSAEADSSAERFRFTTLQSRYNAFCERWDRLQTEKEAGRRPGVYGHFTRLPSDPIEGLDSRPNARSPVSVKGGGATPGQDPVRDLFERYIAARKAAGEDDTALTFERFEERLARERDRLKSQVGDAEIEFDVAERDGKIRLVARQKRAIEN